jgi:hypothetical protein
MTLRTASAVVLVAITGALGSPATDTHAAVTDRAVARGKRILYVKGSPEGDAKRQQQFAANDARIVQHLESLGFVVTTADATGAASLTGGKDLVVISDSARQVPGTFRSLATPVVTWSSELYPALAMTGPQRGKDFGTTGTPGGKDGDRFAWMVNAPHPLSAGLKSNVAQNYYDDNEFMTNWGKPAQGAINIAITPGYPDQRIVFAYENGASMDGDLPAPARRVALFLCTHDFDHLFPTGTALFDAAMLWAVAGTGT